MGGLEQLQPGLAAERVRQPLAELRADILDTGTIRVGDRVKAMDG